MLDLCGRHTIMDGLIEHVCYFVTEIHAKASKSGILVQSMGLSAGSRNAAECWHTIEREEKASLVEDMMGEQLADTLKNLSSDPVQLLQYWGSHNAIAQQSADFYDAALHSLDPLQQPLAYLLVLYVFHIAAPR